MRKIPTLFARDDADRRYVTRDVNPGCEWVLAGEGLPTRKYDGTCVMLDEHGRWWARREVKSGKTPPAGFVSVQADEVTGKAVGWEPVEQSAFVRYHAEAVDNAGAPGVPWPVGTYELIGPKVNGNPEGCGKHLLVRHSTTVEPRGVERRGGQLVLDTGGPASAMANVLADVPLDFDGLAAFMAGFPHEGIVWHHPDGRMVKLKKRDFPTR